MGQAMKFTPLFYTENTAQTSFLVGSMQETRPADEPDQTNADREQSRIQGKWQGAIRSRELTGNPSKGRDQHNQGYVDHGADPRSFG
jgi:hypothetical protein